MTAPVETLLHAHYVRALKGRLPIRAFAPAPCKLLAIGGHLTLIVVSYVGIRYNHYIVVHALLSILIAHSLACIAFLSHELSHKAIVRNRLIRYPIEILLWGLNVMPATMWQRLHNHSHHLYSNTVRDPDRYFLKSELQCPDSRLRRWYARLFFPHRSTSPWNPLVWLHFVTYIARHLLAFCYAGNARPAVVTYKPSYSPAQRTRVLVEVVTIVLLQYGIFRIVGGRLQAFIWASPIPLLGASAFVMAYIWTNHYLHGLYDVNDPVASSTSVIVHPIFDALHCHFSYHTEHHVFPGMNSDFYPLVSQLLNEAFTDRYQRLPITQVWGALFRGEQYIEE